MIEYFIGDNVATSSIVVLTLAAAPAACKHRGSVARMEGAVAPKKSAAMVPSS
jgi:hypothetical protein